MVDGHRMKLERKMGSLIAESVEEFLDSLKQAAVEISNEAELRERLLEAQRWRFAFTTLASNGSSLGIRFEDRSGGRNVEKIHRTFVDFQFPETSEAAFIASLKASQR
jgi:hypothetical protein